MANLIIKSSANDLVIQGSNESPAITVGATGTTTFAENATLSGTANNLGTVTAGTLEDAVTYRNINQDLATTDIPSFPRVTNTAAPCFYVHGNAMNSFAVSNNTHVVLNQVGPAGLNNGGDYSTTTGKYTVPVAGTYIVSVFLYMYTDNTQSWQITVNDVQVAAYYANSSVIIGTDNCATFTQTLDCAVDDLIGFKNTAGGSRNLYAGNVGQCRFWGHFLG